jgi:drug/metabolite transporter (DMT)-like permease
VESTSKAIAHALVSSISFAVMGVFVKLASEVAVFDKVLFRNIVTLVIAAIVVHRNRRAPFGRPENRAALLARSLLGIGGVLCYFWAIDHLLLADAAILVKLAPFFVVVFAAVFLGEPIHSRLVVALILGFTGGLLVIKPQLDLQIFPALIGACSAVFAGGAYVLLRHLRHREPAETVVFVFSLVTVAGMLPFVLPDFHNPTSLEWLWLLGIGVSAAAGQLSLTASYRHAPAGPTSLLGYATIVFAALFGWLFWNEVPDGWSIFGGVLILAGGIVAFTKVPTPPSADGGPARRTDMR